MPLVALLLIVVAAFTHASWNLLAKRAAEGRHFVLLYSAAAVVVWAPLVALLVLAERPSLGPLSWLAFLGTGLLHIAYSELLQRGYRAGDLSVVYPVARGTGPLVSFVGAMVVLGERPSLVAALGALSVVAGVLTLAGGRALLRAGGQRRAVGFGLGIGALIASYTLWDGWAVKTLLVPPLLVDFSGNVVRVLALGPDALRSRAALAGDARRFWREALGVAVLGPLGYVLVLHATRLSTVSHVAPARELSMMVGAYLGARVLREGNTGQRMLASALIVAGVLALALG